MVLPFPVDETGPLGLTAIVAGSTMTEGDLQDRLAEKLPAYMVPSDIVFLAELPFNSNGKIDRKSLLKTLADTLEPV